MEQKTVTILRQSLVVILRLLVGAVFVYSGFVKAIDPWGSYYKFCEYFLAFGMGPLEWLALFLAFAVASVEMVLGVCLLLGAFRRGTVVLLLSMMAVMLPLTLYLAITDAVPDCGCFGDALVISNWATFGKNVLIAAALVFLLRFNRLVPCVMGPAVHWIVALFTFAAAMIIAFAGYLTQPMLDFRPFRVGTHMVSGNQADDESSFVFIYEKGGVEREFSIDSLPGDDWNYVARRSANHSNVVEQQGHAVAVFDGDLEVTSEVFDGGNALLLLFPDIAEVSIAYTYVINQLVQMASRAAVPAYGITSGNAREMALWDDISMASYPLYRADDSEIKMLARGNPAVVMILDGKVAWKRTLRSISPASVTIDRDVTVTPAQIGSRMDRPLELNTVLKWYLAAMLALLVVNRAHRLIWWIMGKFRNKNGATGTSGTTATQGDGI